MPEAFRDLSEPHHDWRIKLAWGRRPAKRFVLTIAVTIDRYGDLKSYDHRRAMHADAFG